MLGNGIAKHPSVAEQMHFCILQPTSWLCSVTSLSPGQCTGRTSFGRGRSGDTQLLWKVGVWKCFPVTYFSHLLSYQKYQLWFADSCGTFTNKEKNPYLRTPKYFLSALCIVNIIFYDDYRTKQKTETEWLQNLVIVSLSLVKWAIVYFPTLTTAMTPVFVTLCCIPLNYPAPHSNVESIALSSH